MKNAEVAPVRSSHWPYAARLVILPLWIAAIAGFFYQLVRFGLPGQ